MFYSLPFEARKVEATEARLNRIYDAAKLGLKGDSLAMAAGMLPTEYRQLCQLDPIAEVAALKGKADGEIEASRQLHKAAAEGDAKASLAILQHVHGWVAKQAVQVEVNQTMVTVSGPDKQAVGEFASKCRAKRKPEPYNGKGIKYSDEVIQRKQGKAFGS